MECLVEVCLEKACPPHRKYSPALAGRLGPQTCLGGWTERALGAQVAQKSPGVSEPSVMEETGSRPPAPPH